VQEHGHYRRGDRPGTHDSVNSNTFRDGQYAKKTLLVLEALSADEKRRLTEVQDKLRRNGALYEGDVQKILGVELHRRLISVGFFDRMEVSNTAEAVGYVASPNDFQKYGRPFEDDPIDDAKALLASLTYGQTRSSYVRGSITMPDALLRALIAGREIGKNGVHAIGEDYRELEARQVVKVTPRGGDRYTLDISSAEFDETFKTNVYAMFWLTKAAIPLMEPGSTIINTASVNAYDPGENIIDYAATKGAIMIFTKGLAKQLAPKGIRVNAIAPGPVWTPLQVTGGQPADKIPEFRKTTPMGRPGQPAELAALYVLLASPESSYSTGQVFAAVGGQGGP